MLLACAAGLKRCSLLLRIQFQVQILEAHFHRAAGVNLQAEDAAAVAAGIIQVHAQLAVDPGANLRADGEDFVLVPFVNLDERLARFAPNQSSTALFVELAPPARADVGLRALHFAVEQEFTAELNAAVLL